jgi:DNA-binding protein H-NS
MKINRIFVIPEGLGTSQNRVKNDNLKSMSVEQLWELHELVVADLSRKMEAERVTLENRLRRIGVVAGEGELRHSRRPYPKVFPKYRNPKNHAETWAGRGKQPRWLAAQLRTRKRVVRLLDPKNCMIANRI